MNIFVDCLLRECSRILTINKMKCICSNLANWKVMLFCFFFPYLLSNKFAPSLLHSISVYFDAFFTWFFFLYFSPQWGYIIRWKLNLNVCITYSLLFHRHSTSLCLYNVVHVVRVEHSVMPSNADGRNRNYTKQK